MTPAQPSSPIDKPAVVAAKQIRMMVGFFHQFYEFRDAEDFINSAARIITDAYAQADSKWESVVCEIATKLSIKSENLAPRAESYLGEIRGHLNTLLLKEEVFDNVAELEDRSAKEQAVREKLVEALNLAKDVIDESTAEGLLVVAGCVAVLAEAEKLEDADG